eukprot:TRINITY_DN4260_c0_g1_i3.p1 TRINITY_DN4260_c0_g1~~TRINITY_DN4260_c0_g1_i3.p1  ORF type:complete len:646 (-),score=85.32 TRINITY_DN4260_c0_g1_i3:69-1955(-)
MKTIRAVALSVFIAAIAFTLHGCGCTNDAMKEAEECMKTVQADSQDASSLEAACGLMNDLFACAGPCYEAPVEDLLGISCITDYACFDTVLDMCEWMRDNMWATLPDCTLSCQPGLAHAPLMAEWRTFGAGRIGCSGEGKDLLAEWLTPSQLGYISEGPDLVNTSSTYLDLADCQSLCDLVPECNSIAWEAKSRECLIKAKSDVCFDTPCLRSSSGDSTIMYHWHFYYKGCGTGDVVSMLNKEWHQMLAIALPCAVLVVVGILTCAYVSWKRKMAKASLEGKDGEQFPVDWSKDQGQKEDEHAVVLASPKTLVQEGALENESGTVHASNSSKPTSTRASSKPLSARTSSKSLSTRTWSKSLCNDDTILPRSDEVTDVAQASWEEQEAPVPTDRTWSKSLCNDDTILPRSDEVTDMAQASWDGIHHEPEEQEAPVPTDRTMIHDAYSTEMPIEYYSATHNQWLAAYVHGAGYLLPSDDTLPVYDVVCGPHGRRQIRKAVPLTSLRLSFNEGDAVIFRNPDSSEWTVGKIRAVNRNMLPLSYKVQAEASTELTEMRADQVKPHFPVGSECIVYAGCEKGWLPGRVKAEGGHELEWVEVEVDGNACSQTVHEYQIRPATDERIEVLYSAAV